MFNLSLVQNQIVFCGLSIQLLSVILVWRTMIVSDKELKSITAGAIWGSGWEIIGIREPLAKSVLKKQYGSLMGLITLFLGIMVQMFSTIIPNNIQYPISPWTVIVYFMILFSIYKIIISLSNKMYYGRIISIFKQRFNTWKTMKKTIDENGIKYIKNEMNNLLDGCVKKEKIEELMNTEITFYNNTVSL